MNVGPGHPTRRRHGWRYAAVKAGRGDHAVARRAPKIVGATAGERHRVEPEYRRPTEIRRCALAPNAIAPAVENPRRGDRPGWRNNIETHIDPGRLPVKPSARGRHERGRAPASG